MPPANVTPNSLVRTTRMEPVHGEVGDSGFVFLVCQQGVESTLKAQFVQPETDFRLAFSRPGLLTFKTSPRKRVEFSSEGNAPPEQSMQWAVPAGLLVRQSGVALGQLSGDQAGELVKQALEIAGDDWDAVHVFSRDRELPGSNGFEPGIGELEEAVLKLFGEQLPKADCSGQPAAQEARVLDVILVAPNQWLVGYHTASATELQWPGGSFPFSKPAPMVSRAYLKIAEALAWSQFPAKPGDRFLEIGSAPGGASQRLLDLGFQVTGVDPAEMDPALLAHPRFDHWRNKSSAIKRKRYSGFRWLAADANVAPSYTLDAVEDIVTYSSSRFEGLVLTMKLTNFELVDRFEEYASRVKEWGFSSVRARQLSFNRRECCMIATR
ncbi:MAG: SAM-dependent methyltransferase [Pirellulaceae bacterium]